MAGGQRIDDHSSWIGGGAKFPKGAKEMEVRSAEGAGGLGEYMDSEKEIVRTQTDSESKINSKKIKPGYRN